MRRRVAVMILSTLGLVGCSGETILTLIQLQTTLEECIQQGSIDFFAAFARLVEIHEVIDGTEDDPDLEIDDISDQGGDNYTFSASRDTTGDGVNNIGLSGNIDYDRDVSSGTPPGTVADVNVTQTDSETGVQITAVLRVVFASSTDYLISGTVTVNNPRADCSSTFTIDQGSPLMLSLPLDDDAFHRLAVGVAGADVTGVFGASFDILGQLVTLVINLNGSNAGISGIDAGDFVIGDFNLPVFPTNEDFDDLIGCFDELFDAVGIILDTGEELIFALETGAMTLPNGYTYDLTQIGGGAFRYSFTIDAPVPADPIVAMEGIISFPSDPFGNQITGNVVLEQFTVDDLGIMANTPVNESVTLGLLNGQLIAAYGAIAVSVNGCSGDIEIPQNSPLSPVGEVQIDVAITAGFSSFDVSLIRPDTNDDFIPVGANINGFDIPPEFLSDLFEFDTGT